MVTTSINGTKSSKFLIYMKKLQVGKSMGTEVKIDNSLVDSGLKRCQLKHSQDFSPSGGLGTGFLGGLILLYAVSCSSSRCQCRWPGWLTNSPEKTNFLFLLDDPNKMMNIQMHRSNFIRAVENTLEVGRSILLQKFANIRQFSDSVIKGFCSRESKYKTSRQIYPKSFSSHHPYSNI